MSCISLFNWTHKGNKLAWDDPVEISVFNSLIVLILFDVKASKIIPAKLDSKLKTLEALQKCTIIETITFACISIVLKKWMIWLELLKCVVSTHLKNDDHKCTHQEGSIDHLVTWIIWWAIVKHSVGRIVLISEKSGQLSWVSMDHGKIQWSKIFVEWEVCQVVINVEEEGVFKVLWWFDIRDPV